MADTIIRALCLAGGVRMLACSAVDLARKICALQRTSVTASIAMARGLAGGALMGALLKDNQRLALKFEGNGPLRKMMIEADSDGAVRGCVAEPQAEVAQDDGHWSVAELIGRAGFLTVSKDLGFGGEPYHGVVQLVSSEVGDDLAYYLTVSEQTPSAVGLAATLAADGKLAVCGGFLVQALPQADEVVLEKIMANIAALPALSSLIDDGGAKGVIGELFGDIPYTLLETHDIFFRCGCGREKVERALLTLGIAVMREMQAEDNGAHVTCEYCRETYHFDTGELEQLIESQSSMSFR